MQLGDVLFLEQTLPWISREQILLSGSLLKSLPEGIIWNTRRKRSLPDRILSDAICMRGSLYLKRPAYQHSFITQKPATTEERSFLLSDQSRVNIILETTSSRTSTKNLTPQHLRDETQSWLIHQPSKSEDTMPRRRDA